MEWVSSVDASILAHLERRYFNAAVFQRLTDATRDIDGAASIAGNAGGVDVRVVPSASPGFRYPREPRDVSTSRIPSSEGGRPKMYPDYNTSMKGIDSRGIKNGLHRVKPAGMHVQRPGRKPNKGEI
jgi:hypothetical protein